MTWSSVVEQSRGCLSSARVAGEQSKTGHQWLIQSSDSTSDVSSQVRAAIEIGGTHYVTFNSAQLLTAIAEEAGLPPDRDEIR